ncbi:hypothetical protein HDE_00025 [Halotydeus destructor]|nr:hypothetical protein HDE_00025 [Halotydeus destructor]
MTFYYITQNTASILYTAVVRGKVALPCDISPPTPDDSVALILWYKDDALAPIYTLDARKGYLEQARTLTSTGLDGRAYFNLHNRPAFLQIDPIRLSDAGDYRCRVDFKKARTVNTVISLKVIVPPEEPVISDMDATELKGLVGPFNEGDELKLICTTTGGKPRPALTWWRDYTIIDDSFEYNDKDVTTNQLTVAALARHHLLSIFTCQAINNNITVPSSTSITLDLNCVIQSNQTLVLQRVSRTQSGSYQCEAHNQQGTALSNSIQLKIRYAPVCKTDVVSILTYAPHAPQEFGSIECIGKNDVGLQQQPCKYQIIPGGAPQFPFACQVANQSDMALVVLCTYDAELASNGSWSSNHLFHRKWQDQTRILVHPRTQYICELFTAADGRLAANITVGLPTYPSTEANSFQFLMTNLPSATTFRAKMYAQNSKGRSEASYVQAATLRPAERLVDSQAGDKGHNALQASGQVLEVQPTLLMFIIVATASALIIIIIIVIVALVRLRRRRTSASLTQRPIDAQTPTNRHLEDRNGHLAPNGSSGGATMFDGEEEDACCCDDDCCDEMLLTTHQADLRQFNSGGGGDYQHSSKGPDIIPSFGYCTGLTDAEGLETKYVEYDKQYSQHAMDHMEGVQYAEITFPSQQTPGHSVAYDTAASVQQLQQYHQQYHPQSHHHLGGVEYAKIEFTKSSRVSVVTGSPKFESTV